MPRKKKNAEGNLANKNLYFYYNVLFYEFINNIIDKIRIKGRRPYQSSRLAQVCRTSKSATKKIINCAQICIYFFRMQLLSSVCHIKAILITLAVSKSYHIHYEVFLPRESIFKL